jgi:thiamine biosynthesis lipoprotein
MLKLKMFSRVFFITFFGCLVFAADAQMTRFSFTESKMGAPFNIVFYSKDSVQAESIAKRCFVLVDSFNFIFSDYIDTSELSILSKTAGANSIPVRLSPALYDILIQSKKAFELSEGAFDITMGPLSKLWRKARKQQLFPTDSTVRSIRNLIGFNKLIFDTLNKTVRITQPGMQLDLGGIAQGYVAQKVIDFLRTQGINQALVNASGDIVMSGAPVNKDGWVVGVNLPQRTDELLNQKLILKNRAVTTSGDAYQFIEKDGIRYSHIINPITGYGVTFQRNVTVIAADGTSADWLATACSILSLKKAKKLASILGAEVLITELKRGRLKLNSTKGFRIFWKLN